MKNLLIIFIVLLFLLTLLSSFGGSIRTAEPFYDEVPAATVQTSVMEAYATPEPTHYDTFTEEEDQAQQAQPQPIPTEYFYEEEQAAQEEDPISLAPEQTSETFADASFEKFEIPEPFLDEENFVGAGAPYV